MEGVSSAVGNSGWLFASPIQTWLHGDRIADGCQRDFVAVVSASSSSLESQRVCEAYQLPKSTSAVGTRSASLRIDSFRFSNGDPSRSVPGWRTF